MNIKTDSIKHAFIPYYALALILAVGIHHTASAMGNNTAFTHYAGGWSGELSQYQKEFLQLALSKSHHKFGPYTIHYTGHDMSQERILKEMLKGKLHTAFSSKWEGGLEDHKDTLAITRPFMGGLLGLRQCIIRKSDLENFQSIRSLDDLKQYKIGQGEGWPDSLIYKHAGLDVVYAADFDSLIPMVARKRFDYIPLSILEAERSLDTFQKKFPDLMIVPNLYIFYPIPVHIIVNKNNTSFLKRLSYGINTALEDGSINNLLYKKLLKNGLKINKTQDTLIHLDNPFIKDAERVSVVNYFKSHFVALDK